MKYFLSSMLEALKIVAILCTVCFIVLFVLNGELDWKEIRIYTFYNFFYGIPLSLVNGYLTDGLDPYFPWDKKPKTRAWVGIASMIIISMITLYILNIILWTLIWGRELSDFFADTNKFNYTIALVITVIISAILHAIEFFKWAQRERLISEKLRKEKLASELNTLKAHIDPHFLFNSFNILYGLIEEDPKKAQFLLNELSGIYRYILENRTEDTNTVASELNFARKYLGLQQARFEDCILLKTSISESNMQLKIPALSLQLLLENAIKHNAFSKEHPLQIDITEEEKYLVVTNNKSARKNLEESGGLGLQNIEDRYQLLDHQSIVLEDKNTTFTVKLPLLK